MATSFSSTDSPISSTSGFADDSSGANVGGMSGSSSSTQTKESAQRVVQGAHQAVDRVAARTLPVLEQWVNTAQHAGDTLNQQVDHLGELQEQWTNEARATVRRYPLASVFGALVVGMLVARMTSH